MLHFTAKESGHLSLNEGPGGGEPPGDITCFESVPQALAGGRLSSQCVVSLGGGGSFRTGLGGGLSTAEFL